MQTRGATHNAATTLPTPNIEQVTEAEWDGALDTNLKGVFLMTKAVLPHMKSRHDGSISGGKWEEGKSKGGVVGPARMQPEDAGRAICVLCSDDAREITGSEIAIDRGYAAGWMSATLIRLAVIGLLPDE